MIKRYNEFLNERLSSRGVEMPDNLIELISYNLYLNVDSGKIYNSTLEDWKEGFELDFSEYEDKITLSEEDIELVNKYYRSCEAVVKNNINYDFIESAYDLSVSEGLLDDGYKLRILVRPEGFYTLLKYTGSNLEEDYEYERFFPDDLKKIESFNDLNYFLFYIGDGTDNNKTRKSMYNVKDILQEMFSELNISSFFDMDESDIRF